MYFYFETKFWSEVFNFKNLSFNYGHVKCYGEIFGSRIEFLALIETYYRTTQIDPVLQKQTGLNLRCHFRQPLGEKPQGISYSNSATSQ